MKKNIIMFLGLAVSMAFSGSVVASKSVLESIEDASQRDAVVKSAKITVINSGYCLLSMESDFDAISPKFTSFFSRVSLNVAKNAVEAVKQMAKDASGGRDLSYIHSHALIALSGKNKKMLRATSSRRGKLAAEFVIWYNILKKFSSERVAKIEEFSQGFFIVDSLVRRGLMFFLPAATAVVGAAGLTVGAVVLAKKGKLGSVGRFIKEKILKRGSGE